jgi:hypothetical protein
MSPPVFNSDGCDINHASSRETRKQTELYTANGLNGPPVKESRRFYFSAISATMQDFAHRAARNLAGEKERPFTEVSTPSS